LCRILHIARSAYYQWLRQPQSKYELENACIAEQVEQIHRIHPDMGYRRIRDELDRNHAIHVNDKRVLRMDRVLHIQSAIRFHRRGCTRSATNPEYVAKNYLNRQFHADAPNQKWLTDVTEFAYLAGGSVHKLYLSAILDLCDRRIVAWKLSGHNDNALVFSTFDAAVACEPDAHPLFHSDRGFQYASLAFRQKLKAAHMKQSMSRVAHCTDNGPMEGFWGILKREMYYGRHFTDRDELVQAISAYITYYNNERIQRGLGIMPPMAFHKRFRCAA
jgi:transposase InsO family protein